MSEKKLDENSIYWFIKLYTNFFDSKEIDYLMHIENGVKYIVFYIMLCLNTSNTNGELMNTLGSLSIPFTTKKLLRDSKGLFYEETEVDNAINILLSIGLLVKKSEDILVVKKHNQMVGSISYEGLRKQEKRNKSNNAVKKHDNNENSNIPKWIEEYNQENNKKNWLYEN